MAGPELLSKLERRLRLQKESVASRLPSHSSVAASSTGLRRVPEARTGTVKEPTDADVSSSIALGAEVARLRIDVEVLQHDLEVSRLQLAKLRAGKHLEQQREHATQRGAISQEHQLEVAEKRRQSCIAEVATAVAEKRALQEEVRTLEEEVASHVVGQAHFGEAIERSQTQENELRQLVEALEANRRNRGAAMQTTTPHEQFPLDRYEIDGTTESGPSADFTAAELEHSREGLGQVGSAAAARDLWASQCNHQGSSNTDEHREPEAEDDSEYDAPLRALEFALSRLRDSMTKSSSARDDLVLEPCSGGSKHTIEEDHDASIPAGTGEAADSFSSHDKHLGNLQQALIHLSTPGAAHDSSLPYPPKKMQEPKARHFQPMPVGLQLISPYASWGQRFQRIMMG